MALVLEFYDSNTSEKRFYEIEKFPLSIGRSKECDLAINSKSVSRKHAQIEKKTEKKFILTDIGSSAGTRVNKISITKQALSEGDIVELGEISFRVGFKEKIQSTKVTAGSRVFNSEICLKGQMEWFGTVIQTDHFISSNFVTMGSKTDCDYIVASENLPSRKFNIFSLNKKTKRWTFHFVEGMEGIYSEFGNNLSLEELKSNPACDKQEDGSYSIELQPDSLVHFHFEGVDFKFQFASHSGKLVTNPFYGFDYVFANFCILSILFHLSLVLMFHIYPYDAEILEDDMFYETNRFVKLLVEPRKEKKLSEKLEKILKKEKKKDSLKKADKLKDSGVKKALSSKKVKEDIQKSLAIFNNNNMEKLLQNAFNTNQNNLITALGGENKDNNMLAMNQGAMNPSQRKLTGEKISTKLKKALKGIKADVKFDITKPKISGAMDPELIRAVVRRHLAKIRYCYEKGLMEDKSIEGVVALAWTINSRGRVTVSSIASSTLGSDTVHNCLKQRVKLWIFPKPKKGKVKVTYPFTFRKS